MPRQPAQPQHRPDTNARAYVPSDPLLNARECALERGQGLSTFWRDVKLGRVPKPFYVSPRAPRWRRSEIIASVEACRAPAVPSPATSAYALTPDKRTGGMAVGAGRGGR